MTTLIAEQDTKAAPSTPPKRRVRSVLIKTGLVLVVALAAFAGIVALQPNDYRVERSAVIAAPPDEVFAQVNDFRNWEAWSPWAKLDPTAKNSFEGPPSGTGAMFSWDGNGQVGAGRMTVTDCRPNELIRIRIDFTRPFQDTGAAEFTFHPEGENTRVTWSMYGQQQYFCKAICMFMSMDKMLGGEFEKGLASMRQIAETKHRSAAVSTTPDAQ